MSRHLGVQLLTGTEGPVQCHITGSREMLGGPPENREKGFAMRLRWQTSSNKYLAQLSILF